MLDPAVGSLITGALALLFAAAARHKLRDPTQFAAVFADYGLASWVSRLRLTWIVPLFELAIAAGLLIRATRTTAASAGALLLLGYAAAIGINLRAGRSAIACGCGGPDEGQPIAGWMLWRNCLLAAALGASVLPWSARALEWTDGVTIGFGLMALALLHASAERLLAQPRTWRPASWRSAP